MPIQVEHWYWLIRLFVDNNMLGAGIQFNRSRNGDDRFYNAARARRSQGYLRRAQSDVTSRQSRRDELAQEKSKPAAPATAPISEPSHLCNLERFLESVTPSVPAQYLSKVLISYELI